MVEVTDNFLSEDDCYSVVDYCKTASYSYGEVDYPGAIPTGMIHEISETSEIYKLFQSKTENLVTEYPLDRMYVNCFAPGENPYFHIDGSHGVTFLFYAIEEWNIEMHGETQFFIDDQIYGVLPYPNRMIKFDANIMHRATSCRDRHRFTLAVKYSL